MNRIKFTPLRVLFSIAVITYLYLWIKLKIHSDEDTQLLSFFLGLICFFLGSLLTLEIYLLVKNVCTILVLRVWEWAIILGTTLSIIFLYNLK